MTSAGSSADEFASAADSLEPGQWAGPIKSGYGIHLDGYVTEKTAGSAPALDQVRDEVSREFLAARRTAGIDSLYQRLSGKYRILIESPAETP